MAQVRDIAFFTIDELKALGFFKVAPITEAEWNIINKALLQKVS